MPSRSPAAEPGPSPSGTLTPEYWAFISYSHRDAAIAARLQRALETYRIPRSLDGRPTPAGVPAPRYFKPVFRDRDDLQASPDLKARVDAALAHSRYLIVVCSPAAAQSAWVNDEIREFKRVHGDQRILALIADGEPFASERAEHPADECFPEALRFDDAGAGRRQGDRGAGPPVRTRAAEPIAADLRPHGDGERLATLKLVAGMLGVGVDSLARRDAQRRNRRMARLAIASLAGVVVMSALAFVALQARNEAQRERAQAESLVEFMLTDLRDKLDQVGRLDILDGVGTRALDYYAHQDLQELDANALGQRARALQLIGALREQRGQLDDALRVFQDARVATATLIAKDPDNAQRVFEHAQSIFYLGLIAWRRGDAQTAETMFSEYGTLAARMVELEPGNAKWRRETAYAAQNMGVFLQSQMRFPEALAAFATAAQVLEALVAQHPEVVGQLAEVQGWSGDTLRLAGHYGKAIDAEASRLALLRASPSQSSDMQMERQVSNANLVIGRCEFDRGNLAAAERALAAAVEQARTMTKADPENQLWWTDLVSAEIYLAQVRLAAGNDAYARQALRDLDPVVNRLRAASPDDPTASVLLPALLLMLEAKVSAPPESRFSELVAAAQKFGASGRRPSPEQTIALASVESLLAERYATTARGPAAATAWRDAIGLVAPLARAGNPPALLLLATAARAIGDDARGNAAADQLSRSEFVSPDRAALRAPVPDPRNAANGHLRSSPNRRSTAATARKSTYNEGSEP
ncbi:MAG: toll/interleukin-1 receptor domain-containing protein [Proteobacteria bacterium]|nr:toll/interleukin-1 receptor domain-containing protein [Pseudomonadota bacterium]